jgi:hypothetical protein
MVRTPGGVPSGAISTPLGGADASQFSKSNDGCNGQTLGPGATCTLDVAFAPTASGAKAATVAATATPGDTATAALAGNGQAPAHLTVTPAPFDFGNVLQGTDSPTQTFTVTNTGEQSTADLDGVLDQGGGSRFQIQPSSTCLAGAPLAGGESCTVDILFHPGASETGTFTATLSFSASPGGSVSSDLSGTAVTVPASLGVRSATAGGPFLPAFEATLQDPVPQNAVFVADFEVRNSGDADAIITTVPPTIINSGPITASLPKGTCGFRSAGGSAVLPAQTTCTIRVQYVTGSTGGLFGNTVEIQSSPGGTVSITLNGTVSGGG